MNCRKSIFKFLGIAAVCAASAACSVDDADDLALVKLGALKKEFVVEADANTFDIDIYANSAFHIERINQADWISLTCGETEDGKGAITAECEFNEGFKRKAGFVLCSDVDARRDTVYVKQKALVDAKIEFANSSVIVAGAGRREHLADRDQHSLLGDHGRHRVCQGRQRRLDRESRNRGFRERKAQSVHHDRGERRR